MSDTTTATTFEEFWPYYLSQHQDPTCRTLHFVGTSIALGCLAVAPFNPSALLVAPIAGYGLAWVGHFVFEKNKPATFGGLKAAAWSLRGDLRMWKHTVMRTLDAEMARAATSPMFAAGAASSTTPTAVA